MRSHVFNGLSYRVIDLPSSVLTEMCRAEGVGPDDPPERVDGLTDAPDTKGKAIRIAQGQAPLDRLETEIHEGLHACGWNLAEDWVRPTARDIARFLWRRGWRPS